MCAIKGPQCQELLESCEAWKPWQTPGRGGSEAVGRGRGWGGRMGRAVTDGPSSMLAGRMLSQESHREKTTWVPSVAKDTGDAIR